MPRFFALRLWSGCSSLFFTLNPHDIRSPLTISMIHEDTRLKREFSLDFTDAEVEEYMKDLLADNPRRLHELVANNPLAATRTFHWTVKLVIRTLFNCADCPGVVPDGIAANEEPGIFGHVRAYLGIVEPQMRKALHIHMLIQLLGFSHPHDLFSTDLLPDTFRRLWLFVASICFRSTEGFANYLQVDAAMEALSKQPLLPLTKKQRGMIGEKRVHESMRAQLRGRGLDKMPDVPPNSAQPSYFTSSMQSNARATAGAWAKEAVDEIAARNRRCATKVA